MIDKIKTCEDRTIKIEGPASSGKTQSLIQRCIHLLENGTSPSEILIETNTAFKAHNLKKRLVEAAGSNAKELAEQVRVCCMSEICIEILSSKEAREFNNRTARVLSDAEYTFFIEDIRTLGQPRRRMRGMLSFFYKKWADAKDKEDWLISEEEDLVYEHAIKILKMRGAMLPQEVSYLCDKFLENDDKQVWQGHFSYVFADDFHNLSKSEQNCICLLASKQLIVTGNTNEVIKLPNKYPNVAGFENFSKLRHNVHEFKLEDTFGSAKINSFCAAICAGSEIKANKSDEDEKDILVIKWLDPNEELNGLTKYLRHMADMEDSYRDSTCIIVPNKHWGNALKKILNQRGFQISDSGFANKIGGDPRDSNKCKALVAYTKLNMLADKNDMVAWRSWCGFDNYLSNSDAWDQLQNYAQSHKISLADSLEEITKSYDEELKEPFPRAYVLAQRWKSGHEFIEKNKARKGFALFSAIGANDLAEFDALNQTIDGDESAAELFAKTREHFDSTHFPDTPHTLHISTYENVAGLKYDNVFIFACVNGYMPKRDVFEPVSTDEKRNEIKINEQHKFYCACSAAKKNLIISYFKKSPLELAEQTKMKVNRVRAEHGERMALVGPSIFLTDTQSEQPSTLSGENLLAEYGID